MEMELWLLVSKVRFGDRVVDCSLYIGIRFNVPTHRHLQFRCGRRSRFFFPSECWTLLQLQRAVRLPAKNTKMFGEFRV